MGERARRSLGKRLARPCVHHWMLPAEGDWVVGVCLHCGESRLFKNHWQQPVFDNARGLCLFAI